MKFKKMKVAAVAFLAFIGMAACGQKIPTADEVAKKIDNKEVLTQEDYTAILDYCADYSKKAQVYFDQINNQPNDSTAEYIRATDEMASLYADYQYLDMFRTVIYNIPMSSLDEKNKAKVDEFAKYQAFPLPDGAGAAMVNPDVVGDIVDMPASDTGNVIATGDGEAVDVNLK